MKHNAIIISSAALLLCAACAGHGSAGNDADAGLQSTPVGERLLHGDSRYAFELGDSVCYARNSVTVQLLEQFGDADLRPLRHALVNLLDGDTIPGAGFDLDSAMMVCLADTSYMADGVVPVDSLPDGVENGAWSKEVSIKIAELTKDYVTYSSTIFSYTGGAHPMTVSRPLTYIFDRAEVLTLDNMFTPEGLDSLPQIVTAGLLAEQDPPVSNLTDAGYFVNILPQPDGVSIRGGLPVFHYDLYTIAPYVMGQTDIEVSPYDLTDLLSSMGRALFLN